MPHSKRIFAFLGYCRTYEDKRGVTRWQEVPVPFGWSLHSPQARLPKDIPFPDNEEEEEEEEEEIEPELDPFEEVEEAAVPDGRTMMSRRK